MQKLVLPPLMSQEKWELLEEGECGCPLGAGRGLKSLKDLFRAGQFCDSTATPLLWVEEWGEGQCCRVQVMAGLVSPAPSTAGMSPAGFSLSGAAGSAFRQNKQQGGCSVELHRIWVVLGHKTHSFFPGLFPQK